jgi:anti-sigma-K factor RskA
MDGETPVSAGVFDSSDGLAIVEAERSVEGYDGAAITIEPEGGSAEPTTTPIMQSA